MNRAGCGRCALVAHPGVAAGVEIARGAGFGAAGVGLACVWVRADVRGLRDDGVGGV